MEIFDYPFMKAAILMGVLLGALFSLMGVFVVTRGMAFFSDFVSHAAILGVALSVLAGVEPSVFLIIFSLFMAFSATSLWSRFALSRDTVLGVLYGATVSFGIILMSVKGLGQRNLAQFLFGDILLVRPLDVWLSACLLLMFSLFLSTNLRKIVKSAFLPEISRAEGVNVKGYDYALVGLTAVTVALSIKIVGVMLANAMVVIPAASAKALSRNFRQFLFFAPLMGVASFLFGLMASFYLNLPSGPSVAASSFLFFLLALSFGALRR